MRRSARHTKRTSMIFDDNAVFAFSISPFSIPTRGPLQERAQTVFFLLVGGARNTPCSAALHCVPKFWLPLPSSGLAAASVARPTTQSRGWSYARFIANPGPFCGRRRRRHWPPRLLKAVLARDSNHWTVQAWSEFEHFWVHRVTWPLLSAHRHADQDDEIWISCKYTATLKWVRDHLWVHRVTWPVLFAHHHADKDDEIWISCDYTATLKRVRDQLWVHRVTWPLLSVYRHTDQDKGIRFQASITI